MGKTTKHKLSPLSDRTIGSVNWVGLWTLYSKEVERFLKVYQQTIAGPALTCIEDAEVARTRNTPDLTVM